MIKIIKRSEVKPTIYDLKVRIMVEGIETACNGYADFKAQFAEKIKQIQQLNSFSCEQSYRLIDKGFYLQVWHRNTQGKNDRLILEVFDIAQQSTIQFND